MDPATPMGVAALVGSAVLAVFALVLLARG
jgi:hypothetical protein